MASDTRIIQISRTAHFHGEIFEHATAACIAGVSVRTLLKYWKMGFIEPIGSVERYGIFFDSDAIFRVRRCEHARKSLHLNLKAAVAMVDLQLENESLREELRFWRG